MEGSAEQSKTKDPGHKSGLKFGHVLVVVILIVIAAIYINSLPYRRTIYLEKKAVNTLRSVGRSQLAYQGTNNSKYYGSFQALKNDKYIAEDYTECNMIQNYNLEWEFYNIDSSYFSRNNWRPGTTEIVFASWLGNNTFTITAFPTQKRRHPLRTFCIAEDQVVRVYNPSVPRNKFEWRSTWDPTM